MTGTFDNWSGSLPLVKQASGEFELTVPLADDKTLFKFIVDGEWKTSPEYEVLAEDGNENNVVYKQDLEGSKIPESGGLVTPTVLPSQEGKQVTLGEPGVVIPENANEIEAFKQVSDVDAKELNEKLNTTNVVIPENAAEIKEFSEVSNVDAKELNEKKKIKVKKVIKRNKETGEEVVLSSEPVEETPAETPAVPVETPKKVSPTPAPLPAPAPAKKKGFFGKLKKAFS